MGDLTKNFSRHEFACKGKNCCGGSAPVSMKLVHGLQDLSDRVALKANGRVPLTINSGFRCIAHNEEVQSQFIERYVPFSSKSQHIMGTAADVSTPDFLTDEEFADIAEEVPAFRDGGIGLYNGRIHVDVRENGPARWDSR